MSKKEDVFVGHPRFPRLVMNDDRNSSLCGKHAVVVRQHVRRILSGLVGRLFDLHYRLSLAAEDSLF